MVSLRAALLSSSDLNCKLAEAQDADDNVCRYCDDRSSRGCIVAE